VTGGTLPTGSGPVKRLRACKRPNAVAFTPRSRLSDGLSAGPVLIQRRTCLLRRIDSPVSARIRLLHRSNWRGIGHVIGAREQRR